MHLSPPSDGSEEPVIMIRHTSISTLSRISALCLAVVVVGGAFGACSSSKSSSDGGTGGSGTGGSTTGTGGSTTGTGGSTAGTGGSTTGTGGAGGGSGGVVGTGGAGGSVVDAAVDGSSSGTMTVTSTAFAAGETVPTANTCAGANTSPPIAWAQVPTTALSFAVLLTDLSNATIHWVIWDVPATTRALPAGLPLTPTLTTPVEVAGAKQAHHIPFFGTADNGYRGPCPGGALHNYQFEVHALDVATLPTVTNASTPPDVHTQILAHSLAFGDLVGTSTAAMSGQ
jgi:hypothetical protein